MLKLRRNPPSFLHRVHFIYEPYRQILFGNLLIPNSNLSTPTDFLNDILTGLNTGKWGQRNRENETIFRNLSVSMYKTERFFYPK